MLALSGFTTTLCTWPSQPCVFSTSSVPTFPTIGLDHTLQAPWNRLHEPLKRLNRDAVEGLLDSCLEFLEGLKFELGL